MYHIPVLAEVSIQYLVTNPDGVYVDATLGGGGHTSLLLEQISDRGKVFGFDQDSEAIQVCRERFAGDARISLVHENFSMIPSVLERNGIENVDGVLMDLGISSHQIDTAERGFSFQAIGPLDMRMNTEDSATAEDFLNSADVDTLTHVIRKYGEERQARRIALAIVNARNIERLHTTEDLRRVIEDALSPVLIHKTLARVFQAIRIYINDELTVLENVLEDIYPLMRHGGRMVVISYHSLEDGRVKRFLRDIVTEAPDNPYRSTNVEKRFTLLTKKPVTPDEDEISQNPRARSARLRAAEKK